MEEEKRKYECALKKQEGGAVMPTYKDLLGMLRSAISRAVNIIAFDEGEKNENGVHEDYIEIVNAVDGPLTMLDGNVPILSEDFSNIYDDDERIILLKLLSILCRLETIDKEISAKY